MHALTGAAAPQTTLMRAKHFYLNISAGYLPAVVLTCPLTCLTNIARLHFRRACLLAIFCPDVGTVGSCPIIRTQYTCLYAASDLGL